MYNENMDSKIQGNIRKYQKRNGENSGQIGT